MAFQYPFFRGNYKWKSNEVISLGGRERSKFYRLLLWIQVWNKLRKLKKKKNIIGLFSLWCTECALVGSYFGKYNKLKHFTWLCGQDAKKGNKYVKLIRPKADELIAMSDFLKREFYKNYSINPEHVIPLGANPDEFSDTHFNRDIDVLGVGSLIPLKQYDVFTKVISRLAVSIPAINSIICGKGPEEENIGLLIKALHLKNNIKLVGELPHKDTLQFMQRARIFMHTSNYEGLGTVCIEALYAGAHVVSFTRPMDKEIPHWHHVSNEEDMVKKVLDLLQSETTKYEPVSAYDASAIVKNIMGLFNR